MLAGLLLLVASVVVGSGSVRSELRAASEARPRDRAGLLEQPGLVRSLALLIAVLAAASAAAQPKPSDGKPATVPADGVQKATPADKPAPDRKPAEQESAEREPGAPRAVYNEALAYLNKDADRAERLLTEARRDAGTDGELRFRATYNMGWVEVQRADAVLAQKPAEALEHLRRAADWFRDAVRLRPDREDARHNLEVALRRILELADSLSKTGDRDLTHRLDAVIEAQRRLVGTARQLVERVSAQEDPNAADQFRSDFRQLAVQQQKILSDGQAVTKSAQEELDALKGKKDEEQTPQDKVRAAQLNNLLHYLNQASQRLGQARSQMRRRQADRSFRRAAVALSDLNRARDQLRGPVEVLDVILADALPLAQLTALKAAADGAAAVPVAGPSDALRGPPAWLTREYLEESQLSLTERTAELTASLQAGLDERKSRPAGPLTDERQQETAAADRFLAMVREAMPFLTKGQTAFESAGKALAADQSSDAAVKPGFGFEQAAERQLEAIVALRDARERFLDLRGLIELTYSHEEQIQGLLPAPPSQDAKNPSDKKEKTKPEAPEVPQAAGIQAAQQLQQENLDRSQRIRNLIEEDLAALPKPPAEADNPTAKPQPADPAAQQAAAERQRLELAKPLLDQARQEMTSAAHSLAKIQRPPAAGPEAADPAPASKTKKPDTADKPPDQPAAKAAAKPDATALEASRQHVSRAIEHLQALRRLFFSIVEHLRETAQRQAQLNDETEQATALKKDEDIAKTVGPLALRQQQLRAVTQQIADALSEQAKQRPDQAAGQQGADPKQLEQFQKIAQQLAEAAKLVADGGTEMQKAGDKMSADKPDWGAARKNQDEALQKLVEALTLLNPPQPDQQNEQGQDEQDQQGAGQQKEKQQPQTQGTDPSRALQAVRDREAQRRRDRESRQRLTQDPVEKDW